MANTAIRLGYLSISSGGGGAGFEEYANLAAFPPVGEEDTIYLALDTKKIYSWAGSSYAELSPSEVTSVNTQTGDVVLDKSDIGLGNVDNTSDADKPISNATQAALDLITDVNWTGDYNNGVTYTVGDGVMYNGASFRMINFIGAAGYPPPAYPGSWLQVTDYVSANDIGLDQVDNTSDADKPISDDTQDALDGLDTRIEALEDTSEVVKFHVFENNALIYADGMPGIRDTSTLIRDGWYFQNATGQKINWYFFDGNPLSSNYQGAITQANFNAYIVMTLDNKNSNPIMALYSLPTGSGDALPGFAHSRWIYQLSTAALSPLSAGTKYLFYIGTNPPVHPELQHIALDLVPVQSIGDKNPSELILTAALNSSSVEPAGEVSWMVESLGVFSPTRKQEMELRIRTVPLNSASKIDSIYLPSYVDDVLEYANLAAFPATGETGVIYVALDTNKIYRWSGSAYVEISPGAIPPVTSVNTKTGDVVLDKTDIGLGNVDNTSDADKPISDDTQDALDLKYDASNPAGYITAAEVPESPVLSVNQQVGDVFLDKYDIGLSNVDNTSDADKPISDDTQDALDDKANTNLDNLVATAIPEGVNLESVSTTNFAIRTKNQLTGNTGDVSIYSGDASSGNSGDLSIYTGAASGTRGNIFVSAPLLSLQDSTSLEFKKASSDILARFQIFHSSNDVGQIYFDRIPSSSQIYIGAMESAIDQNGADVRFSGAWSMSDTDGVYRGSNVYLFTNTQSTFRDAPNVSVSSGNIFIQTNNGFVQGTYTDANSGNISLSTGSKIGSGTRGNLSLDGDYITVNFNQIKNLANGTDNNDAVNVSQLNAILDYTPADTSAWIAPVPDDVKEALDQLADRLDSGTGVTITAFEDMKEPTGFLNRTDSTISFDDSTRIFTIAPVGSSFSFYIKGNKFTKTTAQTVTIPDTSGSHYIYFNTSGVLVSTQVFDISIIEQEAYVSLVYWNTDTTPHSRSYFAEERHGITMDGTTHAYLHTIFGARYLSGLALGGFTIGNGSLDSHAQFTSDSGSIRDEDILHTIGAQTQIPILFRQGQLWRKKAADNFPVIYSGSAGYTGANGRLPYNQYTGGAWQLTQVASNKFVLVHYFATNDVDNKVVGIQGINQYNDVPAARNAASTEITTLSDLPFTEFVPIGTVIFQTNTYTNAIDARIVPVNGANYVDFRGTQLYTPAGEATEHSLLSGLADDDHIQYHTDARGDARYNLKSTGDISETSYSITNSQTSAHNITGFAFDNAIVRSFEAEVSVKIDADADLFEKLSISGIQKGSDWEIAVRSLGDSSGVVFSITSAGQLQYTSLNYTGFVSGIIKFRAITTSV